jgi:tRNA pseudouridine55 synthase
MGRKTSSSVDGVLVLDKPPGPSSHDLVSRVRRALQTRRVGHAGTLDPFATGVLVCCVGKATRLVRFLTGCEKRYEAVARFGFATDTGDPTGEPIGECVEPDLDDADLAAAAAQLTGGIEQVPPMYSAKKQAGRKLYELARAGIEVERPPVRVQVGDWELEPHRDGRVRFRVTVSAGTYVRTLAEDLGKLAGCPAHLESLRRIRSGDFGVEGALAVGPGRDDGPENEDALAALIPLESVPLPLPDARLADDGALADFLHGRAVAPSGWSASGPGQELAVRTADGRLAGVARLAEDGALAPSAVLLDPSPPA